MLVLCKCHGVSGSCTTKTCWRQLSTLRAAALYLKKRYNRAVKVDFQNVAFPEKMGRKRNRFSRANRRQAFRKTDLLYIEQSPDYCYNNGSYRTVGRRCSIKERGRGGGKEERDDGGGTGSTEEGIIGRSGEEQRNSCHLLCESCGLSVRNIVLEVEETCHCKFHWCCTVQCQTCMKRKEIYTCVINNT